MFIKLTAFDDKVYLPDDTYETFVNADEIISLTWDEDRGGTIIDLSNQRIIEVTQTPNEIMSVISRKNRKEK